MKKITWLAAALSQLVLIPSALAQTATETRLDKSPEPQAESSGARKHEGFYLRLAMGFGAYGERFESRSTDRYGGVSGGDASGFATVGELAIGGSVAPGFVLGGGVYTASLVTGTYERDDGVMVPDELEPRRRDFVIVGPFVDWYPNPTQGLHFQAALGLATLNDGWRYDRSDSDPEYAALGGGAMLGVGYEWFVADEWSLGVMARVTGAAVTGKDDNDVRFFHVVGTSPSLLFAATYN